MTLNRAVALEVNLKTVSTNISSLVTLLGEDATLESWFRGAAEPHFVA